MTVKQRHYSTLHLVLDFVLILLTGGLWLLWMLIRFLRK